MKTKTHLTTSYSYGKLTLQIRAKSTRRIDGLTKTLGSLSAEHVMSQADIKGLIRTLASYLK